MAKNKNTISLEPGKGSGIFSEQTTILSAANSLGISLITDCNGKYVCGKCKIRVTEGAQEPAEADRNFFSEKDLEAGWRLGCANYVKDRMKVYLPETADRKNIEILTQGKGEIHSLKPKVHKYFLKLTPQTIKNQAPDEMLIKEYLNGIGVNAGVTINVVRKLPEILRDSEYRVTVVVYGNKVIEIEKGNTTDKNYGIALDVGTTTVVGFLVDLNSGKIVEIASGINGQVEYGSDIITRIQFAIDSPDGLKLLNKKITETINSILRKIYDSANLSENFVYEVVAVGNTTMNHMLLNINPVNISRAPFIPAFKTGITVNAKDIPIEINSGGYCCFLPNIGGFVGSDTVSVALATDLNSGSDVRFALDLGTNGEILAKSNKNFLAASTACGPVFEGANITCGLPAVPGAVDKVRFEDGKINYGTIGGKPPKGICGSGLIDIVAELIKSGIVDETGKFVSEEDFSMEQHSDFMGNNFRKNIVFNKAGVYFIIDEKYPGIYVSQKDIREFQLAKGAIRTGIELLTGLAGCEKQEIAVFYLAGAFGSFINIKNAIAVGLLPEIDENKIVPVGNGAGFGAVKYLLSESERDKTAEFTKETKHVELSTHPEFQDKFAEYLMFPVYNNMEIN